MKNTNNNHFFVYPLFYIKKEANNDVIYTEKENILIFYLTKELNISKTLFV